MCVSYAFLIVSATVWSLPQTASAFSTHNATLSRSFDKTRAVTNDAIVITVMFDNNETNDLRGFSYVDQVHSSLTVTTLSVRVNGANVTNYTFESGWDGDVYVGMTPRRWVLESPTGFPESNPLTASSSVEIVYAITTMSTGSFHLNEFAWIGRYESSSESALGYSEADDGQIVAFGEAIAGTLVFGR